VPQGLPARRAARRLSYQAIFEEGEAKEVRKILLFQGRRRFGEAAPAVEAALEANTNVQKLENLTLRLLETDSWQELLGLA
jgi:hypothetical protein